MGLEYIIAMKRHYLLESIHSYMHVCFIYCLSIYLQWYMISAFSNNDNVRQQILSIVYRIYAFNFFRSSHIEAVKKKKKEKI